MGPISWASLTRAAAWTVAVAFLLASVLLLATGFRVFGGPPEPGSDFLDNVLAGFEWQQSWWPLEFAGTALFALGFVALGVLGPAIGRLAGIGDARGALTSAAFLLAAGLGAASQLLWLGAKPVATSPQYCDCGLLAEEVMSRLMTLDIVSSVQTWLVSGAILAAAVGLVAAGRLGREAGMPASWLTLSLVATALAVVGALLPLFDVAPFDDVVIVVVAGILIPIWAVWLASRARALWPSEVAPA